MQEITDSLICTECRVEFLPHEGGLCNRCNRPFCGEDLFIEGDDTSSRFCRACRSPHAKTRPMLSKHKAASLRVRRRMKKGLG